MTLNCYMGRLKNSLKNFIINLGTFLSAKKKDKKRNVVHVYKKILTCIRPYNLTFLCVCVWGRRDPLSTLNMIGPPHDRYTSRNKDQQQAFTFLFGME